MKRLTKKLILHWKFDMLPPAPISAEAGYANVVKVAMELKTVERRSRWENPELGRPLLYRNWILDEIEKQMFGKVSNPWR